MDTFIDKIIGLVSTQPYTIVYFGLVILAFFIAALLLGSEIKIWGFEVSRNKSANVSYDFQKKLIKNIQVKAKQTIKEIAELDYKQELNWENEFLNTVNALYSGATKVHAITLSEISGFWVSEKDKKLIIDYLNCQRGKEIYRLFVFHSPYDLAQYEEVLISNYIAYGNKGGVYITSKKNYDMNLLPKFCESVNRDKFSRKDFGIWKFKNTSILASLHDTQLSFERINSEKKK